jgi:hypothetical protein
MNSFGIDHRARMLLAREHTVELYDAWKAANGPSLGRDDEPQEPCSEGRYHAFILVVARLFADVRRRPGFAPADPCSQGRITG